MERRLQHANSGFVEQSWSRSLPAAGFGSGANLSREILGPTAALVGARRHIPDRRAVVSGQQWRWQRRSARIAPAPGLSHMAGHRRSLADADLPLTDARFWLRHRRFL